MKSIDLNTQKIARQCSPNGVSWNWKPTTNDIMQHQSLCFIKKCVAPFTYFSLFAFVHFVCTKWSENSVI